MAQRNSIKMDFKHCYWMHRADFGIRFELPPAHSSQYLSLWLVLQHKIRYGVCACAADEKKANNERSKRQMSRQNGENAANAIMRNIPEANRLDGDPFFLVE